LGLGVVELRSFQKAGVEFLIRAQRALLADEMGLGKTAQALSALEAQQAYPAIIVCPASLKLNWAREVERWLPGTKIWVAKPKAPIDSGTQIAILNYDVLSRRLKELLALKPKAIVFDELHYVKTRTSARSKAARLLVQRIPIRYGLTGTPVESRPSELIHQLQVLGRLEDAGGWKRLFFHHAAAQHNGFGYEFGTPRDLDKLNHRMRASFYLRRTKAEVLPELPAKTRVPVWFDVKVPPYEIEKLADVEAARQSAIAAKLDLCLAWIADFLESGEKLVVFAHHRDTQSKLAAAFPGCAVIRGEDDPSSRQASVDRFQSDEKCKLIIASLKAGGVGLTLTAASNVAFVELGWTPAEHAQAEDRCHRIGSINAVTAWYLLAERSIEADIWELLNRKTQVVHQVTEGKHSVSVGPPPHFGGLTPH
jgi:SWI/SNF-related matrix-associated actin-dependent regulator 1 of chromatin subfamily A